MTVSYGYGQTYLWGTLFVRTLGGVWVILNFAYGHYNWLQTNSYIVGFTISYLTSLLLNVWEFATGILQVTLHKKPNT